MKFVVAAVVILSALYSLTILAANPSATPSLVTDTNASTANNNGGAL